MFCKNCGQHINNGVKFCKNCGQEIKLDKVSISSIFFQCITKYKKVFFIVGSIFVVILTVVLFDEYSLDSSKSNNFNPLSSVVNILCTAKNSGELSGGSGTIVSDDGSILTNAHIIPQINETPSVLDDLCIVTIPDENTGQSKEIYYAVPDVTKGLSKKYDIATLLITDVFVDEDGYTWGSFPNSFPSFEENSSCEGKYIRLGDAVRIYGYPITSGGYNLTVTDGIVSSFNDDGTILTSAKIDSGNSGGLAVDEDGCFIGIPSAVSEGDYQNLGVIIPPDLIREFGDELVNFDPSQVNDTYEYQSINNPSFTESEVHITEQPVYNYHNLEDKGYYPKLPSFVKPVINDSIPYYYKGSSTVLFYDSNGQYTPVTGDLNKYKVGRYSAYDNLHIRKSESWAPSGYINWNLSNHLSGYVIIKSGTMGNNVDLYVKDPSACEGVADLENSFNKAGIKISIYNSRFSSSGYLNFCGQGSQTYYYIGSLLPDTYTIDITLPDGWKLSEASGNTVPSGTTAFPRQITIQEGYGSRGEASLWFYIEPK